MAGTMRVVTTARWLDGDFADSQERTDPARQAQVEREGTARMEATSHTAMWWKPGGDW